MMQIGSPFKAIHAAMAAAVHRDLPEITYEDRDWAAWRELIEELYGEFRKPLIALEINISEGNRQKSLEIVRDIHATMFGAK